MARPKRLNTPVKLNLLLDNATKRAAFALASKYDMSVSRLFETLVGAAGKKVKLPR